MRRQLPGGCRPDVGLPAEQVVTIARDFVAAPSASVHVSTGVNMGRQGALAYWLEQMLLLFTGNLDRPGGNIFGSRGYRSASVAAGADASFDHSPWGRTCPPRSATPVSPPPR